jgi:hypothetical protein
LRILDVRIGWGLVISDLGIEGGPLELGRLITRINQQSTIRNQQRINNQ